MPFPRMPFTSPPGLLACSWLLHISGEIITVVGLLALNLASQAGATILAGYTLNFDIYSLKYLNGRGYGGCAFPVRIFCLKGSVQDIIINLLLDS